MVFDLNMNEPESRPARPLSPLLGRRVAYLTKLKISSHDITQAWTKLVSSKLLDY